MGKGGDFCGEWDEFEVLVGILGRCIKPLDILIWFRGDVCTGPCIREQLTQERNPGA